MTLQGKHVLSAALASLLLCGVARAQDSDAKADDPDGKNGAKQQKTSVVDNEVAVGLYVLDDDSYRFGKYSGITDDKAYALVDFLWEQRPAWNSGDAIRWRLQGWRLGLDSRRLEFDWSQQGRQRFRFDYRQVPNNGYRDGLTPYQGIGSSELTLPGGWAVAPGDTWTSAFIDLDDYLQPVRIRSSRKSMSLAYDLKIGAHWNMALDFKHEVKDGLRNTSGIFGSSWPSARAAELPAPIDWTTDNLSLMFHFADGRVQFGGGLYASFFNNDEPAFSWQNAYGKVGNWRPGVAFPDGRGQMALEPDNSYLQLKAYGGFAFSKGTRLTADLSWGSMEQDDAFLPYTINPDLRVRTDLPSTTADAKVETTHFNLRLTSRLARRLNLVANYRYDDRDNKTPRQAFRYVAADSTDQFPAGSSRFNLPYSYTRHTADLLLNWNAARGLGLKGGVEWNDYARTWSEVEDAEEIGWLAGVRLASLQTLSASLDYRYSERDVDEYVGNRPYQASYLPDSLDPEAWQNHPLQRKYNQTDRDRDDLRLRLDWFPVTRFNVGLTARAREDDYGTGYFGLNEAESSAWSVDLGWYPTKTIELTAYYTSEDWEASQSGRMLFSSIPESAEDERFDWWMDSKDEVETYNIHLGLNDLGADGRFALGFDYTVSNVESRIDVTGGEQAYAQPLPALVSDLSAFAVYGKVRLGERSSLVLKVENSELDADDFTLDDVAQDTLRKVLTLGQSTQDYDIMLVTAYWKYQF